MATLLAEEATERELIWEPKEYADSFNTPVLYESPEDLVEKIDGETQYKPAVQQVHTKWYDHFYNLLLKHSY